MLSVFRQLVMPYCHNARVAAQSGLISVYNATMLSLLWRRCVGSTISTCD